MRTTWFGCALALLGWMWSAPLVAQEEIAAQIQRASSAPTIDGLGNDAAWATATVHGRNEFNNVANNEPDSDADLSVSWKGLWDDTNLYLFVEVTDDEIVNEDSCGWEDDSIEIYLDAQDVNSEDYRPGTNPDTPAYQLTAIAGDSADSACARIEAGSTTPFSWGTNSYDGGAGNHYPLGTDKGKSVITAPNKYTLEVAFPWESLEDTPANIQKRGSFGLGVAVNDDDDTGGRDSQLMWSTLDPNLWMRSDVFPSVSLVGGAAAPGDFDADGDLDNADIESLSAAVRGNSTDAKFDVSGDGKVNGDDRTRWVETLKKTWFGDADLNGQFNTADFILVFQKGEYEDTTAGNSDWSDGDWNGDADFNTSDFILAFQGGGYEAGPRAAVSAVPEPATSSLVMLAGLALLGRRRTRRWRG